MKRSTMFIVLVVGALGLYGLNSIAAPSFSKMGEKPVQEKQAAKQELQTRKKGDIKVTFVELGSVNCIPCKAMQPVMKEIEEEYGDQVKVVFHDVWTDEGKAYGEQYKIRAIPTQVFLDKNGKEYFRHMGFFPKEEIVKVLGKQGIGKSAGTEGKSSTQQKESKTNVRSGQMCQ
jgi:thioredoxin 1